VPAPAAGETAVAMRSNLGIAGHASKRTRRRPADSKRSSRKPE
jgi:hypothetical protein